MIRVNKPGLLTTIQDLGRYHLQQYGVPVTGVMDSLAARVANLLVGNEPNSALLEITLHGPELCFEEAVPFVLTGSEMSATLDRKPVPLYQPILPRPRAVLRFGQPKWGCRSYLAVPGGFAVEPVMGSRSTYLYAGVGGFHGRALLSGDLLHVNSPDPPSGSQHHRSRQCLQLVQQLTNTYRGDQPIRVVEGPQWRWFSLDSLLAFFGEPFRINPQSNRMGFRLEGPKLTVGKHRDLLSEAVTRGTIQVPADGVAILLQADCQSTGGYPKIAQVISADLPSVAQLKPGDSLRFQLLPHQQAEHHLLTMERGLEALSRLVRQEGYCYANH